MKTIAVGLFRKTPRPGPFDRTQPFVIAFVYTPDGGYVVKGMQQEVDTYIRQRFPKAIWNETHWKNGRSRSHWRSTHKIYIAQRRNPQRNNRPMYRISIFGPDKYLVQEFWVRRVPKKWLDVYDQAGVESRNAATR